MASDKSAVPPESSKDATEGKGAGSKLGCVLWLVVAVVLSGVVGWWILRNQPPPAANAGRPRGDASRPQPVLAVAAQKADVPDWLTALGTVTPLNSVVIRSRVDGQLLRVNFLEGQIVKADTLLAEIDPRPFEVQLAQASGQIARDQALLENARHDLERYVKLMKEDSIAQQQVDNQKSLVTQYEGAVAADQSQVESAKLNLIYTQITAPITGRLGLRQVDPGNIIHSSDANGLVTMAQIQPIAIIFSIPQERVTRVLARLKKGDSVAVEAWDGDQTVKLATGRLLTTDNQIDIATGTLKLKAEMPNEDGLLFPNQFVNARLLVDTLHGAVVIPTAAIQRGAQGIYVYIVNKDQSVALRPVKLGVADGERTAVSEGLSVGEVVVTDGTDKLREGAKVEVITREGSAKRKSSEH